MFSQNAEYAVIALMLKHQNNLDLFDDLNKSDFYDERCSAVFEAIRACQKTNKKVDYITVSDQLKRFGNDSINSTHLKSLIDNISCHSDNADLYKKELKEKTGERKLVDVSNKIKEIVWKPDFSLEEKVKEVWSRLESMSFGIEDNTKTYAQGKNEVLELIKFKKANKHRNMKFGFEQLDAYTGGIPPDLIAVGGMPGGGKTSLAQQWAAQLAKQDFVVFFASAEMNITELIMRDIQRETGISVITQRLGETTEEEDEIIAGFEAPEKIYINDTSNLDVDKLSVMVRVAKKKHGLDVVIVDYLQNLSTTKYPNNPIEQIAYISKTLKSLSKDLKIPVIALTQYNKNAGQSSDNKPSMADFYGSGQIGKDAGLVILIHRADYFDKAIAQNPNHAMHGIVEFIVPKSRYGPSNVSAWCRFQHNRTKFVELGCNEPIPDDLWDKKKDEADEKAKGFGKSKRS